MQQTLQGHINKIVQISNEEFAEMESFFLKKSFKKDEYLAQAGKTAKYEYFVLSGLVFASHLNDKGKIHVIQFAMENSWITDSHSYNMGKVANLDIKCLEDAEIYCITYENKEKLCAFSKKMEYYFRKISIESNILLQKRIIMSTYANFKERYELFIADYPKIDKRVSRTLLASYVGVTRRTLGEI
ncbi:Crp/Fnr family transcriptional regulator [Flavobacterium pectinovorum]|uniref:Crp/Fnr family transcriptional regulator n=1 Tax=Flavobacterium pectinovorum TaxID=29533 RepID=UPI001FAE3980|nr:Crp/Fnr family transcriptional regulator [Flavobacterium pectinovorum]MCI9845502.1 Crp/Fnr family transcriptional regulator [Flavobacterium pectinovorum]